MFMSTDVWQWLDYRHYSNKPPLRQWFDYAIAPVEAINKEFEPSKPSSKAVEVSSPTPESLPTGLWQVSSQFQRWRSMVERTLR